MKNYIVVLLATFAATGCDSDGCPKAAVPTPFTEITDDLPEKMWFCESDGRVEFPGPGEKFPEGELPNDGHVRFDLESGHHAFLFAIEHFESKGWIRMDQDNELLSLTFGKGHVQLELEYFNVLDDGPIPVVMPGWVHAHAEIRKRPCIDGLGNTTGGVCDGPIRADCVNGWPAATDDCSAETLLCADEHWVSACITEACAVQRKTSGQWSAQECPKELVDAK